MNNNYNYYPNNNYDRFNYDILMGTLGINPNNINTSVSYNNSTSQLYGPYEGYTRGNMFKNLYSEYKNYKPGTLSASSEQENALLNLNEMQFAMHDAVLYLDVYPDDSEMMKNYIDFRDNYNRLLDEYQNRYGALNVNSKNLNNVPFGWEEENWPWDRGNV